MRDPDELADAAMHRQDVIEMTENHRHEPGDAFDILERMTRKWKRLDEFWAAQDAYAASVTDEEYFRELDERIKHE